MNERIRELVRQAGLDDADFPIENWDNVPLAKFAELIVRECMQVLDPGEHQLIARFHARKWLAEHFGVEA